MDDDKGDYFVSDADVTSGAYSLFDDLSQWVDAYIFKGAALYETGIRGYPRWAALLLLGLAFVLARWSVLLLVSINILVGFFLFFCESSRTAPFGKLCCRVALLFVGFLEAVIVLAIAAAAVSAGGSSLSPSGFVFHWTWSKGPSLSKFDPASSVERLSELGIVFRLDTVAFFFITMVVCVGNLCLLSLSELRTSPRMSAAVLFVKAGSMAAFASLGLFSFILFMEGTVVPLLYLLRGGLDARRGRAGIYYLCYSFLSGLMALSVCGYMLGRGFSTMFYSFGVPLTAGSGAVSTVAICFLVVGLLIKVPIVPFQHWLLAAHVEASTSGSVLLAAIL